MKRSCLICGRKHTGSGEVCSAPECISADEAIREHYREMTRRMFSRTVQKQHSDQIGKSSISVQGSPCSPCGDGVTFWLIDH
jgi:hypothetical protein